MMGSLTYPSIYQHYRIFRATSGGTVFSGNVSNDTSMDYFEDSAVVDDCIYFSAGGDTYAGVGVGVRVNVGTPLVADSVTLVWEYYSREASAWVAITEVNDPSNSFQTGGAHDITWDYPAYQARTTVNGYNYPWCRVRITAVTNITEGGANQTDKVKFVWPSIIVEGNNGGNPWTMEDLLAADIAGGWGVVRELAVGFPDVNNFDSLPTGSQALDPWPDREKRWLVNASIIFIDPNEAVMFKAMREVIICHQIDQGGDLMKFPDASYVQFGEYDGVATTRYGCTLIFIGHGYANRTGGINLQVPYYPYSRPRQQQIKGYATTFDNRGSFNVPFYFDFRNNLEYVDCTFLNYNLATFYNTTEVFIRCKFISSVSSVFRLSQGSPTFEDCQFIAGQGCGYVCHIDRPPISLLMWTGIVKSHSSLSYEIYARGVGRTPPESDLSVTFRDFTWSEDGDKIYWRTNSAAYYSYGYVANERSLDLKVVSGAGISVVGAAVKIWDKEGLLVTDEVTDGSGDIPQQHLVTKEFRPLDPTGQASTGSIVTEKTPHRIQIIANGYRTTDFEFTVTTTMEWILGLADSGEGPDGISIELETIGIAEYAEGIEVGLDATGEVEGGDDTSVEMGTVGVAEGD